VGFNVIDLLSAHLLAASLFNGPVTILVSFRLAQPVCRHRNDKYVISDKIVVLEVTSGLVAMTYFLPK